MQQELRKTASIVGIILNALGIVSLAYLVSPVRFMFQAIAEPYKTNLVPIFLGVLALVAGIALLFVCQRKR
jgi:hypothetical protein